MAKRSESGKGFKDQQLGGAWEGDQRKAGPRRFGPGELVRKTGGKGGPSAVLVDVVATLLVAVFFAVGFVLITAYLGSAVGKGWLLAVLSFFLAICAPLALALWAVRPMKGRRAYRWWLGVFGAPFVLATAGLALAVPKRTGFVLHNYGAWLPELIAGKQSAAAEKMQRVVNQVAALFFAIPDEPEEKAKDRSVKVITRPGHKRAALKKLKFTGRGWTHARKVDLTEDQGRRKGIRVSYRRRGGAIIVKGRAGEERQAVTMLLDTGATLTAVSPETAARLKIAAPAGAPMVEVRTAGGPAKYPAAVLSRLSIGKATVKNITVLICGPCSHEGLSGLVGLNFIRHFILTIDEKRSRLTFTPRQHEVNRASDIEPFLVFSGVQGEDRSGAFRVQGQVNNRTASTIRSLVVEAVLLDGDGKVLKRLKGAVGKVKPLGSVPFAVEGKAPPDVDSFRLEVDKAAW